MKSIIMFVLLISGCFAQQKEEEVPAQQRPPRTPQGHIQYSDPDGLRVNWKLFAPYTQWKSHLKVPQRNERAETETVQPAHKSQSEFLKPDSTTPEEKIVRPLQHDQVHYKPYSMVPAHIKQLIFEMYEPQVPYVDPSVYIYRAFQQPQEKEENLENLSEQEESTQTASQNNAKQVYDHKPKYESKYSFSKGKADFVQYKNEPIPAATAIPRYGSVPDRSESNDENGQEQKQHTKYHLQQQRQYQQEESRQFQFQQPEQYQFEQPQQYEERHQYKQQLREQDRQYQQQQEQEQQGNTEVNMPKELHQLLNLQAQTPYHVIANRIFYKPKTLFVPKPILEDTKTPYKYRSKIYFMKNEDIDLKSKDRTGRENKNEQEQEG